MVTLSLTHGEDIFFSGYLALNKFIYD